MAERADLEHALALVRDNSVNITEAAARSGRSYNTFRAAVKDGRISTFSIGRETRVWIPDIEAVS